MVTTHTAESKATALRRLLEVARESGVRLGQDSNGDFYATSVSEPGRLYPVGPESCGCRGFATHRRCRHIAALWSHLGWLDLDDDSEPTPPATGCPVCHGAGQVIVAHSRWIGGSRTGFRNEWSVAAPCPDCQPVAA